MRTIMVCMLTLVVTYGMSQNKGIFINSTFGKDMLSNDPFANIGEGNLFECIDNFSTGHPISLQVGYLFKKSKLKYGFSYSLTHRVLRVRHIESMEVSKIDFNQHAFSLSVIYPIHSFLKSGNSIEMGGDIGFALAEFSSDLINVITTPGAGELNLYYLSFEQGEILPVFSLYGQFVRQLNKGRSVNIGLGLSGQFYRDFSLYASSTDLVLGEFTLSSNFNFSKNFLIWSPFVKFGIEF